MTPLRGSSSQLVDPKTPAAEDTSEGLTAIAQQMINGPAVYLTGSLVTPAQVRLFVQHTRTKLRARTFMVDQLDEHCEGCGISDHKSETCHLKGHSDFNKEGKWFNSSSCKIKKTLNVSKGWERSTLC